MTASRLVIRAIRDGGAWASLLAVTSLLRAGAETLLPAVLGRAVDGVLHGSGTSTWPAVYAALIGAAMTGDILTELAVGAGTATATARLRHRFVRHVLGLGPSAGLSPGDMTSRAVTATADTAYAPSAVIMAVTAVLPPIGGVVALVILDPWLALTFALGLPALALVLRAFVRDTSAVVGRYLDAQGRIAARLAEALAGHRTIAAAGTADHETGRILRPLPELSRHGHATWRVQASAAGRGTLAVPLLQVAVLAVAGLELAAGRLTTGGLLAATQYAGLGADIGPLIAQLGRLARARAGANRLLPVLARPLPSYGTAALPEGAGRLELRGVSAGSVLDGLDLTVPGGRSVAVVGRSGSGKSLLAALAGRLAEPGAGEILLDGVPLTALSRAELRRAVGYAFARPALFGATIAEAIAGDAATARAVAPAATVTARHGRRDGATPGPSSGGDVRTTAGTPADGTTHGPSSANGARAGTRTAGTPADGAGSHFAVTALDGTALDAAGGPGGLAGAVPAGPGAEPDHVADAVRAATAARADVFIRRLPDGYHTPPADAPLSGGEQQRLGLARAFAHPGRLLILDDATSSLDTVTEVQIGEVLTRDARTRLIIAHRAGTAARADLVAWLDGGRIRACAPHHELWSDPDYREAFRE